MRLMVKFHFLYNNCHMRNFLVFLFFVAIAFVLESCKAIQKANMYAVSDDVKLGRQVAGQIDADAQKYPVLPEAGNEKAYGFIREIRDNILNTGRVQYRDQFAWEVKIIKDDKVLNAFCTPGGHIYVYTGLIKFLDTEDELAGVMGHEIAHAAMRHSTRQMTKMLPLSLLASVIGQKYNQEQIAQVTSAVIGLSFSREHETEADEWSVNYLCKTKYNAAGAAGFFRKIQGKGGKTPEFLSTHPNPENRVQKIEQKATKNGCSVQNTNDTRYATIKSLL